ncbi:MAG: hypothetical protein HQK52_23720 [Oligoflexia bacterium]|nr:hypothetical protein [Oligoflexia bacterium]
MSELENKINQNFINFLENFFPKNFSDQLKENPCLWHNTIRQFYEGNRIDNISKIVEEIKRKPDFSIVAFPDADGYANKLTLIEHKHNDAISDLRLEHNFLRNIKDVNDMINIGIFGEYHVLKLVEILKKTGFEIVKDKVYPFKDGGNTSDKYVVLKDNPTAIVFETFQSNR